MARKDEVIRRGRHCEVNLEVTLVLLCRRRGAVLQPAHHEVLRRAMEKVCVDFGAELMEYRGRDDHVVLTIRHGGKFPLFRLVGSLKGVSSRRLRREIPGAASAYVDEALWSPSYFAASRPEDSAAIEAFLSEA